MADRNVNIRLSMKDGDTVRRALMSLGKDGERAMQRLEAAAIPASRGLRVVDTAAVTARNTIAGYTRTIAALYAAQRGIRGVLRLAEAAGDAEELRSKFNAVFRELSDDTRAWAAETATAVGRSKLDLEEYLASLQNTFVPMGFARDRAADLSKTLAQLAIDVASFNNTADDETLNAFTSAIVGNHEAVRRFGIVITEASLKQELMNMGLRNGGRDATEQEKALARLNIIQQSTADAQGDAVRTAGSYTNRVKDLQGAWKDFRAELGAFVTENSGPVLSTLRQMLAGAQGFVDFMNEGRATPLDAQGVDSRIDQIYRLLQLETEGKTQEIRDSIKRQREQLEAELNTLFDLKEKLRDEETSQTKAPERRGPISAVPIPRAKPDQIIIDAIRRKDEAEREAAETAKKRADAIRDVNQALQFEIEQLGRTSTEQAVYNELQRAGVSINSAAGREIAERVRRIEEIKTAQEQHNDEMERQERLLNQILGPIGQYAQHVSDLTSLLNAGKISQEQFNGAMNRLDLSRLQGGGGGGGGGATGNPVVDGLELSLRRMAAEAPSQAETIADSFTSAFDTMEDHFAQFLATGKFSFKGFIDDIIREQARITSRQLFGAFSKALLGSLFGGGAGDVTVNAAGNVLSGGRVTAFASGGVLGGPMFFPMKNGVGLAGEAGPEAIMPLKRGRDGRLGVAAANAGPRSVIIEGDTINIGSLDERNMAQLEQTLDQRDRRIRRQFGSMYADTNSRGGLG